VDPSQKNRCILLVDDDEHQLLTLGDYLAFRGFEVICARGGRQALSKLRDTKPDLILLDLMMPEMHGGQVARSIRAEHGSSGLPIVFMTAAANARELMKSCGVADEPFIAKPIDLEDLVGRVRQYLSG
jgi:DNA-binding response OmpR family regulator